MVHSQLVSMDVQRLQRDLHEPELRVLMIRIVPYAEELDQRLRADRDRRSKPRLPSPWQENLSLFAGVFKV